MYCKVLIIGHGSFPEDIVRVAGMIYGETEHVEAVNLPPGQDLTEYRQKLREVILKYCKSGLLVLADFLGGTPFLTVSKLLQEFWDDEVEMISGYNLPMLTEILNNIDTSGVSELKALALDAAKGGIIDFKAAMTEKMQRTAKEDTK
jgi:PTS system mannose-specific IIA component